MASLSETDATGAARRNPLCPVCQSPLEPHDTHVACADCGTHYHAECWEMNGGCAVYGCAQTLPTEKRTELETPVSYWGKERKPCPACGQEIVASAVRCRLCGATFASAQPASADEYRQQKDQQKRAPELRRGAVLVFVFNALTCSAPIAAIVGLNWWRMHRNELKSQPAIYQALCLIGVVVGFIQTGIGVLAAVFYAASRR